jgi:hypothetical protein
MVGEYRLKIMQMIKEPHFQILLGISNSAATKGEGVAMYRMYIAFKNNHEFRVWNSQLEFVPIFKNMIK